MGCKRSGAPNSDAVKLDVGAGECLAYTVTVENTVALFTIADKRGEVLLTSEGDERLGEFRTTWTPTEAMRRESARVKHALAMGCPPGVAYTWKVEKCNAAGERIKLVRQTRFVPKDSQLGPCHCGAVLRIRLIAANP